MWEHERLTNLVAMVITVIVRKTGSDGEVKGKMEGMTMRALTTHEISGSERM